MVRALAFYQCGPGSNPRVDTIRGLRLLLVPRGFFPGTPVFPSPQKPILPNSNSTRNQVDEEPLCGCSTSKSLFIYLFIIVAKKDKQVNNVHCISHWIVKLDNFTSFSLVRKKMDGSGRLEVTSL